SQRMLNSTGITDWNAGKCSWTSAPTPALRLASLGVPRGTLSTSTGSRLPVSARMPPAQTSSWCSCDRSNRLLTFVADGPDHDRIVPRHRHREFLRTLRRAETNVDRVALHRITPRVHRIGALGAGEVEAGGVVPRDTELVVVAIHPPIRRKDVVLQRVRV